MADAARKNVSKKSKEPVLDAGQARHERLTLYLFLLTGLALVVGMIVLSEFLSQGKANQTVLIVGGVLFGLSALGFLGVYLMRRKAGK